MRWHLEVKRVGIGPQFLDKALLESRQRPIKLDLGVHLLVGQVQVLAERQTQYVQILAAVPKGSQNIAKHFAILNVLRVDQNYAV